MLEKINLMNHFKLIPFEVIANRLIFGFLGKRTKGKVKSFVKRFFLLLSAKPLLPEIYTDEFILTKEKMYFILNNRIALNGLN
jgi:hypothetical protein